MGSVLKCCQARQQSQYVFLLVTIVCVYAWVNLIHYGNVTLFTNKCPWKTPADDGTVLVPIREIVKGEPLQLPQDDKELIKYIWNNKYLEAPSHKSYNLEDPYNDPSMGQGQFIRKILRNMSRGFFLECGGLDGETRSNTLFLEQHLEWEGLVVEADPSNYKKIIQKNRKAWISNTCLAIKPYPHQVSFIQKFNQGKILDTDDKKQKEKYKSQLVSVQCFPLFSLLTALNVSTVDYFSLDVEGNELQVLKTIPFDKVLIKTLSVEYIHNTEGKENIIKFMQSQGFRKVGEVHRANNLAHDVILVHKSVNIDESKIK